MDSKFSISRTWRIACIDFYKWIINSRMIVAAAMIVFVWSFAVTPLMEISREMNSPFAAKAFMQFGISDAIKIIAVNAKAESAKNVNCPSTHSLLLTL